MKDISKKTLTFLYRQLYRVRAVELEIEKLYPADEMKTPVHLCIGQEAAAVGICANLKKDDYCFSNHRGHGHYLAKGGSLKAMIAELYGRETGCSKGRGGSMHLVDTSAGLLGSSSIVAGGIPIAVGAALSAVLKKQKRVSVVFFGDAACEEGVLYESFNFAKLKNLPVIFVCENNFYSVCSPLSHRQPDNHIYSRSKGFSLPAYRVDGTDVLKVYRLADKVIQAARSGKGPVFLECIAYRWRGHAGAGSDAHLGHRTQKELEHWLSKCPLKKLERFLITHKIFKIEYLSAIKQEVNKEIKEAFVFAQNSPFPNIEQLEYYVYKE
ncbi:MAG: thiamine pyrophosphate-dependent dehydrogenase E1 component subunit alpha [Candidatus Omnitrophota bacterium]